MYIKFVSDADLYNTKGEFADRIKFRLGDITSVTGLRYIWIRADKKAELFYEVLNSPARSEEYNFVKASTAKYLFGKHLKPTNTAADVMPANIEKDVKK